MLKAIVFFLLLLIPTYCLSNSISFYDVECKVTTGVDNINSSQGSLANYNCVAVDNDVSCNYTDSKGYQVNKGDKYVIIYNNKKYGLWISSTSNIVILFDYIKSKYQLGTTYFSSKYMSIINKSCVGFIKSH